MNKEIFYKRNAKGKPIFWEIEDIGGAIAVTYGLVGKEGRIESFRTRRKVEDEINSLISAKRKEGYKQLQDLYDNAISGITNTKLLLSYLDTYLPKNNTDNNGAFIPMLCKTLEDDKPFKNHYFGEYKINGERCIITATKTVDLFNPIKLNYRSRTGIDWTDKLSYLDEYLIPKISKTILDMMLEEDVALDGELYLPGYNINDINHFIKNTNVPQHYQLQYWLYDLAIDNMSAIARYTTLEGNFLNYLKTFIDKNEHLNNQERLVLLPIDDVFNFNAANTLRDEYIDLGFEGIVIRQLDADYQFGGKRNNSMLKYKKIADGIFKIVDIVPEGVKRSHLPKFICKNDINDELFECTINLPQTEQAAILINKDNYIDKNMLVEYRERSGVKQVPFHAKAIKIMS